MRFSHSIRITISIEAELRVFREALQDGVSRIHLLGTSQSQNEDYTQTSNVRLNEVYGAVACVPRCRRPSSQSVGREDVELIMFISQQ